MVPQWVPVRLAHVLNMCPVCHVSVNLHATTNLILLLCPCSRTENSPLNHFRPNVYQILVLNCVISSCAIVTEMYVYTGLICAELGFLCLPKLKQPYTLVVSYHC